MIISFGFKKAVMSRNKNVIKKADSKRTETLRSSLLEMADKNEREGNFVKARTALQEFLDRFPDSPDYGETENRIEGLNMKILFSSSVTEDSFSYAIKPGDTLGKIARNFNTTVELLKRSNGLSSDIIIPGKTLKITKNEYEILVDRSDNMLFLKTKNGDVVRSYHVSTGESLSTPTGTFKIEEKMISPVWYKVGAVVDPASSEYELGSRWMGLSIEGYGIHGTKDPSLIGKHITKGCVRMRNEEVEELYAIVPSGSIVTIIE